MPLRLNHLAIYDFLPKVQRVVNQTWRILTNRNMEWGREWQLNLNPNDLYVKLRSVCAKVTGLVVLTISCYSRSVISRRYLDLNMNKLWRMSLTIIMCSNSIRHRHWATLLCHFYHKMLIGNRCTMMAILRLTHGYDPQNLVTSPRSAIIQKERHHCQHHQQPHSAHSWVYTILRSHDNLITSHYK